MTLLLTQNDLEGLLSLEDALTAVEQAFRCYKRPERSIRRDALDAQRIGHMGTLRAHTGTMSLEFNMLLTPAGTIIPRGFTSLIKPYLPSLKGKSVLTGLFSSHQK
jgi:hypothetical protein